MADAVSGTIDESEGLQSHSVSIVYRPDLSTGPKALNSFQL